MRFAEILERPRWLLAAAVLLQWLTTAAVAVRADAIDIGATELLNGLVLGPVGLLCAYRISVAVGGVALGAWALLVWIAAPWTLQIVTLASYDETLRDRVLPLGLGLTPEPGYACGVALLAAAMLLARGGAVASLASGAAAGVALLLTPEAVLFAVPAALAFFAARRPKELGFFLVALAPALLIVLVWRQPSFGNLSLDRLEGHFAGLREYFWSQRLLQWLPLAGAIALGRCSVPLAILFGGWFGAFLLLTTRRGVGFDNGELFRVLLPALPAYVLLAAALPLLVPTLAARLGPLAQPAGP